MILTYELMRELYVTKNYTIPDFKREFSIPSKQLIFLLDYFGIPHRTQEKITTIRKAKTEITVMKRYGVTSTNSLPHVKSTKRAACLKKYGVDNVAKVKQFSEQATKTKKERYGSTALAFVNKTEQEKRQIMQKAWKGSEKWRDNLTPEDKSRISSELSKRYKAWYSRLSEEEKLLLLQKRRTFISKLEDKVYEAIKSIDAPIKRQHWINRLSYDFKIGRNLILEINGDYWHANPLLYERGEIIPFPNMGLKKAEDIWEKDVKKRKNAESYGYEVFYLWELDLNEMSREDIHDFVKRIVDAHCKK